MKCFNHHSEDAIGLCKACNKGLCSECATEIGNSIACKNTCTEEVAAIDDQILKSRVTISAQKNNRMFMPAFFIVLGGIFAFTSIYRTGALDMRSVPGLAFIFFGIVLIFINRKWVKDMEVKHNKAKQAGTH